MELGICVTAFVEIAEFNEILECPIEICSFLIPRKKNICGKISRQKWPCQENTFIPDSTGSKKTEEKRNGVQKLWGGNYDDITTGSDSH